MLRRKKGFTLIELLIVIAIIGILAAIAIPMYQAQTLKARLTEVVNAMSHVASGMTAFYDENGYFPAVDRAGINNSFGVGIAQMTRCPSITSSAIGLIDSGAIVNVGNPVDGTNLTMSASTDATTRGIIWIYGGSIPIAYMPKK